MKNPQEPAPAVVYNEMPTRWLALIILNLVCLAWIAAGFVWDFSLGEFDVFPWALPVTTLVLTIAGWRRIEVGPSGIRVFRRGRLHLERPLADFSHIQPGMFGISAIVLRGGPRIWAPVMGEGSRLFDYLATLPRESSSGHAHGGQERPDELELLITAVHLDMKFCVGCGMASDGPVELDASHGIDLFFVSWSLHRSVMLPGCAACRRSRRLLTFTLYVLSIVTCFLGMMGPIVFKGFGGAPLWGTVLLSSFGALYFLNNWGAQLVDDCVLGISARSLSKDGTRVVLRVRKPGVLRELERGLHPG
ncbi:hypothetical protein ACN28I_45890 [Archangium gephyra]|uniref:hypothetical protein n=1 Tax=Archangium gephyra TaxID=48 RepID=UPI003B7BF56A